MFKYVKVVLWVFAYFELFYMVVLMKNLSFGLLLMKDLYYIFDIIYWIMLGVTVVMFPLIIFFTVIMVIKDLQAKSDMERGLM